MNDNLTDITILLDRTGSMDEIKDDVIGGFNAFVKQQQEQPGECALSLVQFDSLEPHEVIHNAVPIRNVARLTGRTYTPRASTPLLDALGTTIVDTGNRLSAMDEANRPGKVVFVVITDGYENSSEEYTREQVFEMIKTQRETYNWQFVFLAAGQDAIEEGAKHGFTAGSSMSFARTSAGIGSAMRRSSDRVSAYRSTGDAASLAFSDAERDEAVSDIDKE